MNFNTDNKYGVIYADPPWLESGGGKIKRGAETTRLELTENADILKHLSSSSQHRPKLVVGFAAETENVIKNASKKRLSKGRDWILANDVSLGTNVFGGTTNKVHVIDASAIYVRT